MQKLVRTLAEHYQKNKRDLPWRPPSLKLRKGTADPYSILVSEIMLQQTQVERVVPFYKKFLKKFPTPQKLAKAKLKEVLLLWQGLGYNRRAKFLHEAVKIISEAKARRAGVGVVFISPERRVFEKQFSTEFLESLPGVGHYTARAVAAFAFNRPEVFIETNIRTVFLHHLYRGESSVSDKELLSRVAQALKKSKMKPRNFYAALMDYGAYLKGQGIKINFRSKHYVKQSKFKGSIRQLRSALLRELLKKPVSVLQLAKATGRTKREVERELSRLQKEDLIKKFSNRFSVSD